MKFYRINITSSCNLSCKHCHTKTYYNKPVFMDYSTLELSINQLLSLHKNEISPEIILSIYGGEPFLNKKILFKAIEKFGNVSEGVKINWIINTNGTLVAKEDVEFLKRFKVDLHVSIDGPEEVHNSTRIDKRGKPSFASAKKAIEMAVESEMPVQINSYITPINLNHLKELVDLSYEEGVKRIYLDWLYSEEISMNCVKVVHEYLKALKYAELKGISINGPWKTILSNYLNNQTKNLSDYSVLRAVEITPKGMFFFRSFPLTRKTPFKISKLKEILASKKAEHFLQACQNYFTKRCKGCSLEKYCFGTAIVQHQYHLNKDTGRNNVCEMTKKIVSNLSTHKGKEQSLKTVQVNITYDCNRNCNHCYVKDFLNKNENMSLKDFCSLLDWLENNGIKSINITGGEPTQHPDFKNIIKLANNRGFHVNLFSNFLFPESLSDSIEKIGGFLINISEEKFYSKKEYECVNKNLKRFSRG
ncbi:MAG: radical SAM protein [Nanoarchaeota archaeon]